MVSELLLQQRYQVTELYATQHWFEDQGLNSLDYRSSNVVEKAETDANKYPDTWVQKPALNLINDKELKRISSLSTPNQVLAVVDFPQSSLATSLVQLQNSWSLYLDGLQQPANLGAILRVADWFGFQRVIAGPGTVGLYNPKSIQATMGCFLRLDYHEASLTDVKAACPDLPIFAADLDGHNINSFKAPKQGLLIIGNEGRGIRPETRDLVTDYLMIPRVADRQAESLNAAVATGILCSRLASTNG